MKAGNDPATALWRGSLEGFGAFSRAVEIAWTRAAGPAALAARAAQRTAELVAFARARSPFYRDAWRVLPAREIRGGIKGGSPWHMPPHPEVPASQARTIARYIMSLAP